MIRAFSIILVAAAALFAFTPPAHASGCPSRETAVASLEAEFGLAPMWRGLNGKGNVAEIWVNPKTGAWTYLVSSPDGLACVIDRGEFWRSVEFVAPVRGEAS